MFDGVFRFQISEKWANLRFSLNIQKQKVFQLQGLVMPPLCQILNTPLITSTGDELFGVAYLPR